VLLAVLAAVPGCSTRQLPAPASPATATSPGSAPPPPEQRRQLAALAFISYLGEQLTGSDDEVERELAPCLTRELAGQPLTRDTWTLAWGPAVYRFSIGHFDDNMMYVVRNAGDPAQLAIVVRGTNAKSILDWLVEDFDVDDQVAWETGNPPPSGAKISKGTSEGLHILLTMTAEGGPAPGQTLGAFLTTQAQGHPALKVSVVGHSLGGALATALAQWLKDTQPSWDPARAARIGVYALAGPTAGNAELAGYYDSQLGPATERVHNPYDIVPLAWNVQTLGQIPDLYEPLIRADAALRALLDGLRDLVKDRGYTQVKADAPPLPGAAIDSAKPSFPEQAGWQHTCGYRCPLGLVGTKFLPVTLDCRTRPAPHCPVCPPPS